jgi:hypothetical protein
MNLYYNPDHQQHLEHHKELLKEAQQERFALDALKAQQGERSASPALRFLWRLFARRPHNLTRTVSHSRVHS